MRRSCIWRGRRHCRRRRSVRCDSFLRGRDFVRRGCWPRIGPLNATRRCRPKRRCSTSTIRTGMRFWFWTERMPWRRQGCWSAARSVESIRCSCQRHFVDNGVGSQLLARVLQTCARSLLKHVMVGVSEENVAATALFRKMGFSRVGTLRSYRVSNAGDRQVSHSGYPTPTIA